MFQDSTAFPFFCYISCFFCSPFNSLWQLCIILHCLLAPPGIFQLRPCTAVALKQDKIWSLFTQWLAIFLHWMRTDKKLMHFVPEGKIKIMIIVERQQTQSGFKSKLNHQIQIRLTPVTGSSVSASGPWFPLTFLYAASILLLALQVNNSVCADALMLYRSLDQQLLSLKPALLQQRDTWHHTHPPLLSVCHGMVVVKQNFNGTSGSCCPPLLGLILPPSALGRLSAVVASLSVAAAGCLSVSVQPD